MITVRDDNDRWDEADCLCQSKVPEDKQIDYIQRIFDEKQQKWRNKVVMRCHKDCPIHGISVKE